MRIGVSPVSMQRASCEKVQSSCAIFILISRCTRLIFVRLYSVFSAFAHTGTPYDIKGSIAPCKIILIALSLSPHAILADLDSAWISLVHLSVICSMFWSKVNFSGLCECVCLYVSVCVCVIVCVYFFADCR